MARKSKKDVEIQEVQETQEVEVQDIPKPDIKAFGDTPSQRELARAFGIARRNVVNPETYDFFDDIIGKTYQFDRYDPYESKAAFEMAYKYGTRVEVPIGNLTATYGSINAYGSGWKVTTDYIHGDGTIFAIIEGDGPLLNAGEDGMFYLEIIFADPSNDAVKVQNFCGFDNCTFAGGRGAGESGPVFDRLVGTIHRVPFYYKEGEPNSGPGNTEANKLKLKFSGVTDADEVYIASMKVYKVII